MIKPYTGVIFTLVSQPLSLMLPETPYVSSVVVLIGAVTILSFFVPRGANSKPRIIKFLGIHTLSLLFIVWIFVSNPEVAWFGMTRNWVLTFFQCWVLLWISGQLLDTTKKQQIFMWVFGVAVGISAVVTISEGQIGDTIITSTRAGGLAGQPNATARYLVTAMIFNSYLIATQKRRLPRLLSIVGTILTSVGVFFTLSRTGILMQFIAVGLIILMNFSEKKWRPLIIVYFAAAIIMVIYVEQIVGIIGSILPAIQQGSDTVGIRYSLWRAGWKMWVDHMISGVGIGMYPQLVQYYAPNLPPHYWGITAHNTYILVLAETGIVGFILFLSMMIASLRNFVSYKSSESGRDSLRKTWLIAIIVNAIGAATMSAQYDKLLWFLMGVSVCFQITSKNEQTNSELISIQTDRRFQLDR